MSLAIRHQNEKPNIYGNELSCRYVSLHRHTNADPYKGLNQNNELLSVYFHIVSVMRGRNAVCSYRVVPCHLRQVKNVVDSQIRLSQ